VEDTSFLPELKSPAAGEKAALDDKASISIVIDERKRLNEATKRIVVAVVGIAAIDILIICCRLSLLDNLKIGCCDGLFSSASSRCYYYYYYLRLSGTLSSYLFAATIVFIVAMIFLTKKMCTK
jgi:hypothetical protein